MNKPVHILNVVIKNTSTMDFTLPLLWGLRKNNPDIKITILYCVGNKKQILRDSKFVDEFCEQNSINQYDFSDFMKSPFGFLKPLWRAIFVHSYSDNISFKSFLKVKGLYTKIKLFWFLVLRGIKVAEYQIGKRLVDTENILPHLNPDFILFDNRTVTRFYGRENFYSYFEKKRVPLALLPHAPHYNSPTDEYCPFDEQNKNPLPPYTEHWMPYKFATPWLAAPEHKKQFIMTGYPGLDKKWIAHIMQKKKPENGLRCLVLTRKFLPKDNIRPENMDPFTLDYAEVFEAFVHIKDAIDKCDTKIKLVIKPHPSSSKTENIALLQEAGITNYEITYESFYELLPNIDFEVSQFSTSLVLPVAYGIPTIVLNTKVQQMIHKQWDIVRDMYLGLNFFAENYIVMHSQFQEVVGILQGKIDNKKVIDDIQYISNYCDTNSINKIINRINFTIDANLKSI